MSDPYEDHPLREEWSQFKYYTDGVDTARMQNSAEIDGELKPCVKVFVKDHSYLSLVKEKAKDLELVEYKTDLSEPNEIIFVKEDNA